MKPLLLFMEEKGFNLTQGIALLLLKPLNLPANYFLNLKIPLLTLEIILVINYVSRSKKI